MPGIHLRIAYFAPAGIYGVSTTIRITSIEELHPPIHTVMYNGSLGTKLPETPVEWRPLVPLRLLEKVVTIAV
jgi:hypothetical protein